jgi:hypothetical protein
MLGLCRSTAARAAYRIASRCVPDASCHLGLEKRFMDHVMIGRVHRLAVFA